MNSLLKRSLVVTSIIFLLAACGSLAASPAPEPVTVSEPTREIPTLSLPVEVAAEDQYIGLQYPPFPAGLTQEISMLIQDKDGYGLFLITDRGNKILWLSKITGYGANGTSSWEVKDVLAVSDLEPGLMLIPDGCSLNGVPDSEIFVAGKNDEIVLAWRANTTLDVFEEIPLAGIKCSSDKATPLD